jgi:signal transduction histidine kinase
MEAIMGYGIVITTALVTIVATGCASLAFGWIFQRRLAKEQSARTSKALIVMMLAASSAALATWFFASTWLMWPFYDALLAVIGGYAWFRSFRSRGLSLVDEHIAESERVRAREELATRQAFFLRALAHDLRQPLNSITLNASLIKSGVEVSESADAILASSKLAAEYLSQLLDLARSATDHIHLSRVDLSQLIEQVSARHRVTASAKRLALNFSVPSGVGVMADAPRLERIISNLVDNAIKYTGADGGVSVSAQPRGDGTVAIIVKDSGIGIPPEHMAKLFDEFYQIDNANRDATKGWGLGLAICKRLANQIGGEIFVESGEKGTTFEVLLASA